MNDPDIQLWCEDEVHFQRHSSLIRMWAPKGQQPRVLSASTRAKVGYFGALDLKTVCLLTEEAATFNAETFGDFPFSSPTYAGKDTPYSGQCQLAQSPRADRLFHRQPRPPGARFPPALFS